MNHSHSGSILLVEDDENAREVLSTLLKVKFPHRQIHCAGDGKTGFQLAERVCPDIVITDINMPEMDGMRLLASVHAFSPATRFIVVTAHSDRQILEKITAMELAVDIISKPIDLPLLLATIEKNSP